MSHTHDAATQQQCTASGGRELLVLVLKAVVGTAVVLVGFANIFHLMGWSHQYNQVLVFFVFFVWMSVAGMLFWGGVKGLWGKIKG